MPFAVEDTLAFNRAVFLPRGSRGVFCLFVDAFIRRCVYNHLLRVFHHGEHGGHGVAWGVFCLCVDVSIR
jgi:hypothetical protein